MAPVYCISHQFKDQNLWKFAKSTFFKQIYRDRAYWNCAKQAEGVPSEVVEVQRLLLRSMMPTFGFHSVVTSLHLEFLSFSVAINLNNNCHSTSGTSEGTLRLSLSTKASLLKLGKLIVNSVCFLLLLCLVCPYWQKWVFKSTSLQNVSNIWVKFL